MACQRHDDVISTKRSAFHWLIVVLPRLLPSARRKSDRKNLAGPMTTVMRSPTTTTISVRGQPDEPLAAGVGCCSCLPVANSDSSMSGTYLSAFCCGVSMHESHLLKVSGRVLVALEAMAKRVHVSLVQPLSAEPGGYLSELMLLQPLAKLKHCPKSRSHRLSVSQRTAVGSLGPWRRSHLLCPESRPQGMSASVSTAHLAPGGAHVYCVS